MKNVITIAKKGILAGALLVSVLGFAKDAKVSVKKDAKVTSITLENVKQGDLISIKDTNGIVLLKKLVASAGTYQKGFDLTGLPIGNYFFEVDKDLEVQTIPFKINMINVEFNKSGETTNYKPHTKQEGDYVYLTKFCPNHEATIISIYGEITEGDYKLIHSEKIENTQKIEKVFKLNKGNYKIKIHSNNKEYTKFINN
ncbi:hypothetical protein [Tamlana sp. I1]|uniref:hypothetical protein n=1 Tax=Tamlana sp. I1 TaxID=2762061 RepID=UPI00188DD7FC|nr:hypothetical protein [Tamlana sp. I1]